MSNSTGNRGGGFYSLESEISLEDCLLQGNQVIEDFGFVETFQPPFSAVRAGGLYSRNCDISLRNCSIRENSTFAPTGDGDGGGMFLRGENTACLENCSFSENVAEGRSPDGSALVVGFDITAKVSNSTFSKNTTHADGFLGGTILTFGANLSLTHCTLFDNQSTGTATAGLSISQSDDTDQLILKSCIIRNNENEDTPPISIRPRFVTSMGNNIIGETDLGSSFDQPGDLVGTDTPILLSPLGDYGGPAQTCLPLPGSPAINRSMVLDPEVPTDQRGQNRDSLPDSGAAEFIESIDYPSLFLTDFDDDGIALGLEVSIGTDPTVPDPGSPRNLSMPQFDSTGNAQLNFNYNPDAPTGTEWIVSRTTDLITFAPLFEFDGQTMTSLESGDTFDLSDTQFTITDTVPISEKAFYQLKAEYTPPSN